MAAQCKQRDAASFPFHFKVSKYHLVKYNTNVNEREHDMAASFTTKKHWLSTRKYVL